MRERQITDQRSAPHRKKGDTFVAAARQVFAEMTGTFFLTFFGAGVNLVFRASEGSLQLAAVALANGLTLLVLIPFLGPVSGAHFNPAVTLALAFHRRLSWRRAPFYLSAQLAGATFAASILAAVAPFTLERAVTLPAVSPPAAALAEGILTSLLLLTIYGTVLDPRAPRGFAAPAIALTVTADILIGAPVSGASMNPARSFGPALLAGILAHQWIYWAGPVIGAVLASLLYERCILTSGVPRICHPPGSY